MRVKALLYTLSIIVITISMTVWSPQYTDYYGSRARRLQGIVKIYTESQLAEADYLIYVRAYLDRKIYQIATNGLNPYLSLKPPSNTKYITSELKELENKGINSELQVNVLIGKYLYGANRNQCKTILCKKPRYGCVGIWGLISYSMEDLYSNVTLKGKTKLNAAHPVRIYLLYDIGTETKNTIRDSVVVSSPEAKPCPEALRTKYEIIQALQEEIRPLIAGYGELRLQVIATVKVVSKVKLHSTHHGNDGTTYTYQFTCKVEVNAKIYVTDIKSDALIYHNGIRRVTWIGTLHVEKQKSRYKSLDHQIPEKTKTCIITFSYVIG
ncbi:MAG: hypothetical protein DRN81_02550 [Thermoproteota archaeon]|nr:MAG: hypothetical protein DRN81_02550 [Candidatus Korarchaeota archaeon]